MGWPALCPSLEVAAMVIAKIRENEIPILDYMLDLL